MQKILFSLLMAAGVACSGTAQAALHDRGSGLLYDDVLNITWLQDANYAKTSNYDVDGKMTWSNAVTWADKLEYHDSVRNVEYSDWRLASNTPVGASWNVLSSNLNNGASDLGFNITSPHSELSYMYYVNLGLVGLKSTDGDYQGSFGIFGNGTQGGEKNVGLVENLQSDRYWSGTTHPIFSYRAFDFYTNQGRQSFDEKTGQSFAWAVRSGDVAPVPEPETYAMLMAGLGLMGFVARRRQQKATNA